jgi:hypothetical protein
MFGRGARPWLPPPNKNAVISGFGSPMDSTGVLKSDLSGPDKVSAKPAWRQPGISAQNAALLADWIADCLR